MSAPVVVGGGRVPPHSLEAEQAVLGGILLDNSAIGAVTPILRADDFYSRANGLVFEAMLELTRRGQPVDTVTVRAWLLDRGQHQRAGGDEHILALTNTIPTLANVERYAAIVREKAVVRRLITSCHEIAARGYGDYGDTRAYVELAARQIADVTKRADPKRRRLTAREQALQLGTLGEALPTTFGTLDLSTRGGLRAGKFVVLGGAPGAGKTTLAVQLARHFHRRGHAVLIVAADESAPGLLIRWGQQAGCIREQLERPGYEDAKQQLADDLDERVVFVDQDEASTFESELAAFAPIAAATELPGVVVVDSIQKVRTLAGDHADGERARIDAGVMACKAAARAGCLVIATSEMARGFYRGGSENATEALGSFKESGGIEYGVDVALALASVKGEPDLVHVEIAKNRLGPRAEFRMKLDRDRARFSETFMEDVEELDEEAEKKREAAREGRLEADAERLVAELVKARANGAEIRSRRDLRALGKGRIAWRMQVIEHLFATGRLVGGGNKPIEPRKQLEMEAHA